VVIIDGFLSEEALESMRRFGLESTVWFTNRYAHGRLGAFFREGFNCPLLVQIADELRRAFPKLIGTERLEQIWGFRYANQPKTHPHADFAAVNVNFWLTPTTANLDRNTGGLVIHEMAAPKDWDFASFNKDGPKITAYLKAQNPHQAYIPYRSNRAVIFRSDLFHGTAPVSFSTDYEQLRTSVTMLFGKRSTKA
jgi:hypothetical protein